jgi:hypothetical protein
MILAVSQQLAGLAIISTYSTCALRVHSSPIMLLFTEVKQVAN